MTTQITLTLEPMRRGFYNIDRQVRACLPELPEQGLLHLFCQHTSAGLMISENADPDVGHDLDLLLDRSAPENLPGYRHTMEGSDDMPAHYKSILTGSSLTVPITRGRLNLGTWQSIYFCEFRRHGGQRRIILTVVS